MPRVAAAAPRERSVGRLPAPLTSFVGRQVETEKVAAMLGGHRLVTVTGPGGSGKTRLAIEVAGRVSDRFADGVIWVDLGGVDREELVLSAVAVSAGVRQHQRKSLLESLVAALAARQLLVVLDNCEHLVDAVAETCQLLLAECDDLWLMATSTAPLRVLGEVLFPVPALALPPPGGSLGQVTSAAAVALFVERVSAADPDFAVSDQSRQVVEEIVRRLDGMPLAIELAAARASVLGLGELRTGLDDRFGLLVGDTRGVPARQQSLRSAIDWSYRLLAETDQEIYRRLAVFLAPFTMSAAISVCGPRAREAIARLVQCSLVTAPIGGADGRARYRMLESVRAHADSLLSDPERARAADGLLQWALAQDFRLQDHYFFTGQDFATISRIDAEKDNLRQAIRWAADNAPETRLRLEVAIGPWYVHRGLLSEGIQGLRTALDGCPEPIPELSAAAEFWLGYLCSRAVKLDEAVAHCASSVRAAETAADPVWIARCLVGSVVPLGNLGRLSEAAQNAERALAIARRADDPLTAASATLSRGVIAYYQREYTTGLALVGEVEAVLGPNAGVMVRQIQTLCHLELGHLAEADQAAQAALDLIRRRDQAHTYEAMMLEWVALIAQDQGRISEAAERNSEALRHARAHGNRLTETDALFTAASICAAMGRPAEAATLLAAWDIAAQAIGLVDAHDDADSVKLRAELSEVLSVEQMQAAWDRGATMGTAAAIELACSLASPSPLDQSAVVGDALRLSRRERELLNLVAQGATDAQIAEQLFISIRTVRSHLDRIRDKTGARRRVDLARLILEPR